MQRIQMETVLTILSTIVRMRAVHQQLIEMDAQIEMVMARLT
jgi:hypothetical protein